MTATENGDNDPVVNCSCLQQSVDIQIIPVDFFQHCMLTMAPVRLWRLQTMPSPFLSHDGDVSLVLEDGTMLRAHSVYLKHASAVLKDALACACPLEDDAPAAEPSAEFADQRSPKKRRIDTLHGVNQLIRLPLPGISARQAQLLLTCLYSWTRESWFESLGPPALIELGKAAHRLACTRVLELVDKYLVKASGVEEDVARSTDEDNAWLTLANAPRQHQLVLQLQLTSYRDHVGRFMGRHAHDVDLSSVEAGTAAVLRGARLMMKK